VLVLEDHDPAEGAPNLWKTLAKAVCRKRTDKRKRIAVDDSKNLKGAKSSTTTHPLKHLERAVLAFGFEADLPACDNEFFQRIDAAADSHDWYATSTPLPVGQGADELRIAASRLARTMRETGVRCEVIRCDAIDAAEFNRQVAKTNNKAAINMAAALRHVDCIWSRWPQQHPRIIIDRHGDEATVATNADGMTALLRRVQMAPEEEADLLARQLVLERSDPIYEAALRAALVLLDAARREAARR
jgi:hypothetical protein